MMAPPHVTGPPGSSSPTGSSSPARSDQAELARGWANALVRTAYSPRSRDEIECLAQDLVGELFGLIRAEKFAAGPAREIDARLVTEHFIGDQSLSCTVQMLGQILTTSPSLQRIGRLGDKVRSLLGEMAAGYAAALRARTLDQQEQLKQALLQARQNAERELQVSEAKSLLHDADGKPTNHVTIVDDVTEPHLLAEQLRHQSLHDFLTGLPNQQFFVSSLERALGRAGQTGWITVCKIDLDGFTVVNDAFGRQIGDQLLRSVAWRLQSVTAGEQATIARFGADEFAILIENSPATPDVAALAARINTELAEPVYIEGHGMALSCGTGFVQHQGGGIEPAELLRAAEAALHRVKRSGRRQWGLFDQHRDTDHRARCQLAATVPGGHPVRCHPIRYRAPERDLAPSGGRSRDGSSSPAAQARQYPDRRGPPYSSGFSRPGQLPPLTF